jgi:hypothetical protein
MTLTAALQELQTLLYGVNYTVFLHHYQLPVTPKATVKDYILQALPAAKIGGIQPITAPEAVRQVEDALRYAGDTGAGPYPAALAAPRYEALLQVLLGHVEQACSNITTLVSFWLRDGHPAYPVFWDFALLWVQPQQVELLIGASSD